MIITGLFYVRQNTKGGFQLISFFGLATVCVATTRTAFEISGHVEVDSHIQLLTSLRNGQFSTSSLLFFLVLRQLEAEHSGRNYLILPHLLFGKHFWDIVRVPLTVPQVVAEQSNDKGGWGWEKNIPYCLGNVTKRAPPRYGIEHPVSGWTSLLQTKLIPAGVC